MRSVRFPQPVAIIVGMGFPHEVADALEAYKLLNEWPESSRGSGHLLALHTCAAALGGHGTATDAFEAFEAFAVERGILAADALRRSAEALGKEWKVI